MRHLQVGNTAINYQVKHIENSGRMTIHVTSDRVLVVVPAGAPEEDVEEFVHRRRRWIFTKVDEVNEQSIRLLKTRPSRFATGSKIPYRGRMMRLHVEEAGSSGISIRYSNGFYVLVPSEGATDYEIRIALERWMEAQLKSDIRSWIPEYARKLHIEPPVFNIKKMKRYWGNLSPKGIINLNRDLVFLHRKLAEYVVAHEMCHLIYNNHSEAFWNLLRSVYPDTDTARVELDAMGLKWE